MDFQSQAINLSWGSKEKLDLYRQMTRIRRFEQTALLQYNSGKMAGFLFLSIGQETIAATVRSLMTANDHTISGCRGIGHAIAAGMSMNSIMAEFYGKATGSSKGKAGSFSFYSPTRNHWGSHGLAAAHTPLAAGLAFALKQQQTPGAVCCFLGDGSVNQGVFHESLNLAGLLNLPVVYIIENNGYAMGTSVARSSSFRGSLAKRAEGYDIDWDLFSDENPYEIRARTHAALERARARSRPSLIEISTYRYYGFTIADAQAKRYRSPEEIEREKARNPLELWGQTLLREGIVDQDGLDEISKQSKAEAMEAAKFASDAAPPRLSEIIEDVYWETDHHSPSSKLGRHFFQE